MIDLALQIGIVSCILIITLLPVTLFCFICVLIYDFFKTIMDGDI